MEWFETIPFSIKGDGKGNKSSKGLALMGPNIDESCKGGQDSRKGDEWRKGYGKGKHYGGFSVGDDESNSDELCKGGKDSRKGDESGKGHGKGKHSEEGFGFGEFGPNSDESCACGRNIDMPFLIYQLEQENRELKRYAVQLERQVSRMKNVVHMLINHDIVQ